MSPWTVYRTPFPAEGTLIPSRPSPLVYTFDYHDVCSTHALYCNEPLDEYRGVLRWTCRLSLSLQTTYRFPRLPAERVQLRSSRPQTGREAAGPLPKRVMPADRPTSTWALFVPCFSAFADALWAVQIFASHAFLLPQRFSLLSARRPRAMQWLEEL